MEPDRNSSFKNLVKSSGVQSHKIKIGKPSAIKKQVELDWT